jgi:ABC-2 type transport system permease protein
MLADGSASGAWARWLSPFGWLENLGSFHHRDPWWLVALVLAPGVLAYVGWRAQSGRDIGSALWTRADDAAPREALLGSPWTFSWRERRAMVLVWLAGLGVFGAVLGYLTHTLVAFAATDRSFVRLLDHWGFGAMVHGAGFIGEMGVILSLATSLFVVAMIVVVGGDGETGRLDLPLSYGTSRAAWLGAAVTTCLVSVVVLAGVCATTMWLGVVASGSSMGITTPLEALANALGTAPLYLGVTMVLVALVPRFAYVTMAALLSLDYLVAVLGPILRWPSLVIEASPFHYLRAVPVQSSDVGAIGVMTLIGLVVGALGFWRFMTDDVGH